MPHKINPISYRLGLSQLWNTNTTMYGSNINFLGNAKNFFFCFFIKTFLKAHGLETGNLRWVILPSKVLLTVTFVHFFKHPDDLSPLVKKLTAFLLFLYNLPVKVYLLRSLNWSCTSEFLKCYLEFKLKKNNSLKQVVKNVTQIIRTQLNTKKIAYTTYGPVLLKLKGFKLKSSGKFPNSRNQLGQSIQSNVGCLPLSKINNYVEYSQTFIFTKSGIYSLHIWLLYST